MGSILQYPPSSLTQTMDPSRAQVLEDYTEPMNSVRQAFEDMQDCIHKDYPMIESGQQIDTMRERHVHSAVSHKQHSANRRWRSAR